MGGSNIVQRLVTYIGLRAYLDLSPSMKKDIGEGDRHSLRRFAGLVATFSPNASGLAMMDSGSAVMGPPKTVSHSGLRLFGVSRPVRVSDDAKDTLEGERGSNDGGRREADGATGDVVGGTDLFG